VAWNLGDPVLATQFLTGITLGTTTKAGIIDGNSSGAKAATNVSGGLGPGALPRKIVASVGASDVRMVFTAGVAGLVAASVLKGYVDYTLAEAI
jgi:hypothetical protein